MKTIAVRELRNGIADALNHVIYQGERVVVERRGKAVAAIVPMADLEVINQLEDEIDLEAVRKARKEKGAIPLGKVKARLGIK